MTAGTDASGSGDADSAASGSGSADSLGSETQEASGADGASAKTAGKTILSPHERDRRFIAWLKTATPYELAQAMLRAKRDWHKAAILRAAAKAKGGVRSVRR